MDAEKEAKRLREVMLDHKKKETDPEYRKEYEEVSKRVDEALTSWPNDTDD